MIALSVECESDRGLLALSEVLTEYCGVSVVRVAPDVVQTAFPSGAGAGKPKPLRALFAIYYRAATRPDPMTRSPERQQAFATALSTWLQFAG